MTLLIDIGNSRAKYCYIQKNESGPFTSIKAVNNSNFNEPLFNEYFIDAKKIIIASVAAKALTTRLEHWCKQNKLRYVEVKSEKEKDCLISGYDQPQQLGVDRWLTLLAAKHLYPNKNILIIDAGTATTVDLLSCSGQHLGGWILGGVSTLFTSVIKETTMVNAKALDQASLAFGKGTTNNVNNACWAATVGIINQAIIQAQLEIKALDEIIITGGNAKGLQELVPTSMTRIDELVFYGLNIYD